MGSFDDLAAQFDQVERKGKGDEFERVCKWFLENDPTYKPLLRRVWLWKDWPGRRDIDHGIDLVAEDRDGKTWAIQAKADAPHRAITQLGVNSFISASSRAIFTHRLLIGTTDKRHRLAANLMDDLGIPFIGLTQLREADDYLDWPATPGALRPAKPLKPKKPWDYQKAAVKDVVKGFKTADRGQLIMACGTGKTLTAWFITQKLESDRAARAAALGPGHADGWPWKTLVLVPSLSLLKQTLTEWRLANPKTPFEAMTVCSDESVGSLGEDAAVSHISDLGVPVTTDPNTIATFLRHRTGPARVVFATYQSSPQVAAAFDLSRNKDGSSQTPGFDLVIADEAHRVAGPVSSDFATVLDPTAIVAKRRLFMTATPRYFTGRILRAAKDADYEVASMDDHTKFGAVFHRLSFSEAIERKLLTDYQVAIIGVDDATYRDWAERGTLVTLDGKKLTDARSLAGQIGLAKAMKKFDLRRMISFHSRVKAAKEFATSMPAVLDWMPTRQRPKGTLWSDHASGEMSAGERHTLLQHLKRLDDGERGLLANARCLSEGVDVPALDGVAFIDPRRSEVDIVQAVGRAIRKSDNKTVGTIVIPVFIDTDEDVVVALDSSVFKPVWDVIKALRAHDTHLGEQLDALRRERGRRAGKPPLPDRIHVDIPTAVGTAFVDAFDAHLVDMTTANWEFWFGLLERYIDEHGTAAVLLDEEVAGHKLGRWCSNQRTRRGQMTSDQVARLDALAGWSWDRHGDRWEAAYERLLAYVGECGDARVPQSFEVNGFGLGSWVLDQRSAFARDSLDPDRQRRLEELPGWSWDPNAEAWENGFNRLVAYVKEHGDSRVLKSQEVDGFRLGQWAAVQRTLFAKDSLEAERQQRLEALPGWAWNTHSDAWEEGFSRLVAYAEEHGDSRVPMPYEVDGYRLGYWVSNQRSLFAKDSLDPDRQRRLEALTGWSWNALVNRWEQGFVQLVAYVKEHGDAKVPQNYRSPDGFRLGVWVTVQRREYASKNIDPDRQQRLDVLPGWAWNTRAAQWEEGFAQLSAYVKENGDSRVPKSFEADGFRLGLWVNNQRSRFNNGTLDPERRSRLESLPGWIWNGKT